MLYKLKARSTDGKFDRLDPVAFKDFSNFGNLEKDLEELIAVSILDLLFEDARVMPISQERPFQSEADIYALNEKGELIIIELKRSAAGEDAVQQALRYAQEAGQWSYSKLQSKYNKYINSGTDLTLAHKEAFGLEQPLEAKELNKKQHLWIIGGAADENLINAIDYWKRNGISIEFLPYRIFEINGENYFEFFALPYDRHRNPAAVKGVLFDTNLSWQENAIRDMMQNSRVAAIGNAKRFIEYINPGDIVFFSHKGTGLVAAGRVKKGDIKSLDDETLYRDVEFLTPTPKKEQTIGAIPFWKVSEITGKSFFWARTIKVPYLSKDEAENLVVESKAYLEKNA